MPRRFYTLDVFTRDRCAGNPLAVITEAQELDDTRMQAIAAEFNLPETVFVLPPEQPGHRAALRIFTPRRELPFAGHPTVGTAVLLALLDRGSPGQAAFTLEEKEGPVPCTIAITGPDHGRARFTLPTLPRRFGALCDRATLARGLDVEPEEIGFGAHQPGIYSAGVPFAFVPLRSRDAVTRARPNGEAFTRAFDTVAQGFPNAYVYCANPIEPCTLIMRGCSPRAWESPKIPPPAVPLPPSPP